MWAYAYRFNLGYRPSFTRDGRYILWPAYADTTYVFDSASGATLLEWRSPNFKRHKSRLEICDGNIVALIRFDNREERVFSFSEIFNGSANYVDAMQLAVELEGLRQAAENAEYEKDKYWAILPRVKQVLSSTPVETIRARELLSQLASKEDEMPPAARAQYFRYHGEVAEAEGDTAEAIRRFKQAMTIDPKVGVKRRLEQLKKG